MWWRKKTEKTDEMNKCFWASICAGTDGILGGTIWLKDDAFYFICKKATSPEQYKRLKIPYSDIKWISFKTIGFMGSVYPVTELELENDQFYDFIILNQKKFLTNINKMCQWGA